MQNLDNKITSYIFNNPVEAIGLLEKYGYSIKKPVILPYINKAIFEAVYFEKNKAFTDELLINISKGDYANFEPITMGISAGLSIISSVLGSQQAKKQLELQRKIALANLSQQKILGEESIRTGAETERTKILLQTLQQYQSDLQSQSTQRLKDVWIYVGIVGASIALIYGVSVLLTSKSE